MHLESTKSREWGCHESRWNHSRFPVKNTWDSLCDALRSYETCDWGLDEHQVVPDLRNLLGSEILHKKRVNKQSLPPKDTLSIKNILHLWRDDGESLCINHDTTANGLIWHGTCDLWITKTLSNSSRPGCKTVRARTLFCCKICARNGYVLWYSSLEMSFKLHTSGKKSYHCWGPRVGEGRIERGTAACQPGSVARLQKTLNRS